VASAGADGARAGLDRIQVAIPASLSGKGRVDIVVTAGGKASNAVHAVLD
jgi:uncharacterized protein (TIGR03437 family)